MSREIKFKAWDLENKQMIDAESWFFSEEFEPFVDSVKNAQEHFDLMQFTGLKDKNGYEIFEGDILEIIEANDSDHGFCFSIGYKFTVLWLEDGFWLVPYNKTLEVIKTEKTGTGICGKCISYSGLFSENHEIDIGHFSKVIGNIYENPELLKD